MNKRIMKTLMILVFMILAMNFSLPANAASPKLSKTNAVIQVKKALNLKVTGTSKKIKWNSSKKSVATVTQKGKVTARKVGTTTITAKVGSIKLQCKVKVTSKTSSANWKSLYKTFLGKSFLTVDKTSAFPVTISIKDCYFTLVDINQDGVKELVIKEKFDSYGPCRPIAYTFTIRKGKVLYAGSTCIKQDYSNKILISRKYKSIYDCYGVASYTPTYYYTIKNGKLSIEKFFYAQYGYGKDAYGWDIPHEAWCKSSGYYINKKKVTRSKFNRETKKYEDSLVKYTLSANTKSNRKRFLG